MRAIEWMPYSVALHYGSVRAMCKMPWTGSVFSWWMGIPIRNENHPKQIFNHFFFALNATLIEIQEIYALSWYAAVIHRWPFIAIHLYEFVTEYFLSKRKSLVREFTNRMSFDIQQGHSPLVEYPSGKSNWVAKSTESLRTEPQKLNFFFPIRQLLLFHLSDTLLRTRVLSIVFHRNDDNKKREKKNDLDRLSSTRITRKTHKTKKSD